MWSCLRSGLNWQGHGVAGEKEIRRNPAGAGMEPMYRELNKACALEKGKEWKGRTFYS